MLVVILLPETEEEIEKNTWARHQIVKNVKEWWEEENLLLMELRFLIEVEEEVATLSLEWGVFIQALVGKPACSKVRQCQVCDLFFRI